MIQFMLERSCDSKEGFHLGKKRSALAIETRVANRTVRRRNIATFHIPPAPPVSMLGMEWVSAHAGNCLKMCSVLATKQATLNPGGRGDTQCGNISSLYRWIVLSDYPARSILIGSAKTWCLNVFRTGVFAARASVS